MRRDIVRIMRVRYARLADSIGKGRRASGSILLVSRYGCLIFGADPPEHIPSTLGQQTQTLLRTTMESRLTDKASRPASIMVLSDVVGSTWLLIRIRTKRYANATG